MRDGDAGPFDFDGGHERGVLCIHGFTGTPYEVRPLGERLASMGFTAVGPLLPGHGQDVHALNATTWRDWTAGVEQALDDLRRRCARVAIAGLSLGGLLTLHLAARAADVRAIALLGTPLWLPRWIGAASFALDALPFPGGRLSSVPKAGPDIRDPGEKRRFPTLGGIPLRALRSLIDFMPRVRGSLPQIHAPALIMHADKDHVAPPASALELERRLGSRDTRLVRLPRSFHIITVDVEREQVAQEVGDFLSART